MIGSDFTKGAELREEPVPEDVIVANFFQCPFCYGPVDRFNPLFQCRNCKSIGDLIFGVMIESYEMRKARYATYAARKKSQKR